MVIGLTLGIAASSFTLAVEAEVIRKKKGVIAVATAQVDTAQYKFGGSSALFNPSSLDHLLIDDINGSNDLDTNWTFECWYRPNNRTGTVYPVILANHTTSWASGDWGFFDRHNAASTKFTFFINAYSSVSPALESTTVVSNGTWYHLAVVKQGNDYELFVNGTSEDTLTTAAAIATNRDLRIGSSGNATTKTVDGHIDEVRISNTARYTSGFTPSTLPFVNDDNTKLLLHCDGSDGSQFFDDDNGVGRSAVGVQANGNAQVDTAQYKFGGTSALFDGTEDWLQVNENPIPSSGDFTVEFWFRPSAIGTLRPVWSNRDTGGTHRGTLYINTVGGITWWNASDNLNALNFGNLSANTWYHIACVKDGTTRRIFVNGIGDSATSSFTRGDILEIGAAKYTGTAFPNEVIGHIDEFRISDTARYTADFTAPTAPFVNDANTKLLLHMEGTDARTLFLDDNGSTGTVARTPTVDVSASLTTADSKFGGTSWEVDYTTTGDKLTLPVSEYPDIKTGTSAFTIEGWFKPDLPGASGQGNSRFFYFGGTVNGANSVGCAITTGGMIFRGPGAGDLAFNQSNSDWKHYAFVYDGTNKSIYYDGSRVATTAASLDVSDSTDPVLGSSLGDDRFNYSGYIDEFRITKSAVYTGTSYTVPACPFQRDSDTISLLHLDGANGSTDFVEEVNNARARTPLVSNGNAQIDTAQYKFGGASALFDGTGDYLTFYHDITATDDFVFEGWVRFNALPSSGGYSFLAGNSLGNNRYFAVKNESGTYRFETGVNGTSGSFYSWWNTSLSTGTWYHWALVKNGTSLSMYQDGSALSITGSSGSMTQDKHLFNGGNGLLGSWSGFTQYFNGWMDEIRISNTARYTSGFTPSTTPFQNDANTVLLLHCDGSDGSTDFVEDNGKESA